MLKRRADQPTECAPSSKRSKLSSPDHLSHLSDELLLRIFSNLPIYDLTVCQRVSQRFHTVAGDSQLWKAAYYDRFVRPRASRVPRRSSTQPSNATPSKLSRWLDEDVLVKRGTATNWKRQYRLRHKWSNGTCRIKDIPIPSPPVPPVLARLHEGVVYTADATEGLRAWAYKHNQCLLATRSLQPVVSGDKSSLRPTSLAVDSSGQNQSLQLLLVGFADGAFSVYSYQKQDKIFEHLYSHPKSSNGQIYALAFSWPFVLSIAANQTLSLYKFDPSELKQSGSAGSLGDPQLLTSLKSQSSWPPLTLSLRIQPSRVLAAVSYCTPTYTSSWTTGIQEIHLSPDGDILDTRLAFADSQVPFRSVASFATEYSLGAPAAASLLSSSRPTSLSYSHPYLLAGHSDNTLTLYMVTSTATTLSISAGKRLWGHTSSVFGAHVGSRGKAVSVSSRGDEIRIWELERSNLRGSSGAGAEEHPLSVPIMPEGRMSCMPPRLNMLPAALARRSCAEEHAAYTAAAGEAREVGVTRGWVGFDEENVVVLKEQSPGRQALAIYDFS